MDIQNNLYYYICIKTFLSSVNYILSCKFPTKVNNSTFFCYFKYPFTFVILMIQYTTKITNPSIYTKKKPYQNKVPKGQEMEF